MLIFDAHLDLSMNAMEWNRDLTMTVEEIRESEKLMEDRKDRGNGTTTFPEMRKCGMGIVVATTIARYMDPRTKKKLCPATVWHSVDQAYAQTQGQIAWYRAMEERGEMVSIRDSAALDAQVKLWQGPTNDKTPIGYILSLEGADSIRTPQHLQRHWDQGLRAIGPVHYGAGRYGHGTHSEGPLGELGIELLKEMERIGYILDATHLCDTSFWEAMDNFGGAVWASHSNTRALVPHERQFDDEQLKTLISKGAVIGAVFDAWMVVPDWQRGQTKPNETEATIAKVVDHIDHICQLAGNTKHCGIGTDLDGGYGTEQCPKDLNTIADVARVADILSERNYTDEQIEGIMYKNFVEFLKKTWG